jgi:hypothetical protein
MAMGLLAGLIQVAAGVLMYVFGIYFVPWSIAISLAVLMLCIVYLTRRYRDSALKGQLSYRQAFIIGVVISVCTGIVYAVYNLISISFIYRNFLENMPEGMTAKTVAISNLIRLSLFGTWLSIFAAVYSRRSNPKQNL